MNIRMINQNCVKEILCKRINNRFHQTLRTMENKVANLDKISIHQVELLNFEKNNILTPQLVKIAEQQRVYLNRVNELLETQISRLQNKAELLESKLKRYI